ncbi:Do family serine endopeptidase [Labilibaculum sp. A4]|uniref:Do family serine endopeptidase n=1 Tax=Labilibaculum euxinus TaxID=2686357 RepID=A0A425YEI3_9BACT|nr:Do family serine endopeptidase [Labilibaculum euxinus]MDQ1771989.1 Do family serine endopeptidase [Labilibaculum euxinus]MUP39482.1 Do family serine endopeptidase [Labilibaculum euxinus]MVB08687.1 Do family serine endopeptidase [Labilibaculum euxinus]MWN75661.1 Do family serine endopeptidase [Labilibaculum euxinus]
MKLKLFLGKLAIAILGGTIAVLLFVLFTDKKERIITVPEVRTTQLTNHTVGVPQVDLTYAAEMSVKSVVHVKTLYSNEEYQSNPFYDFLFGERGRSQQPRASIGSGSGVIISDDGYIVTNNHVVQGSNLINIVLYDKREYEGKLVGFDPYTDLALIKIDEKDLPKMDFGNSDDLKLGEWVLAVGNPFNLTSTVTAGIISAKARNLGLNGNRMSIESFLQTDAAVNPGNSGGALVDTKGRLIGINTAIESRTGSYSGYSFAIPVTIVEKVIGDLKKYGEVQRAFIGVSIRTVDANLADEFKIDKIEGVYVAGINEDGAAENAGIKKGDIILNIEGKVVNSSAELQEQISKFHPGDKIKVLIKRNEERKQIEVVLRNRLGNTNVIKSKDLAFLGAEFEPISTQEKYRLQINRGVRVKNLRDGKFKDEKIKEGFIIYKINETPIFKVDDIKDALQDVKDGGVFISGIYPDGSVKYYAFSLNDKD